MRKALLAVAVLCASLLVLAGVVYAVPDLRDEAQWRWTLLRGGESRYSSYLSEWPRGRHVGDARRRLDEARWDTAAAANTIPSFQRYLRLQPNGLQAGQARSRIDTLRWQRARAADTIAAYEQYVAASGDGAHVKQARTRTTELKWERAAEQIADRACDSGRRLVLHRAPSLYSSLEPSFSSAQFVFYSVSLVGARARGYKPLARAPCGELTILGAAPGGDDPFDPGGRWVFAARGRGSSVRGWVYIGNPGGIDWSVVPRTPPETLLPPSRGRPDLAFGGSVQTYRVGQSCPNGMVNVWNLVVRNQGAGAAPAVTRLKVTPLHPHYFNGRRVDPSRVLTFRFARAFLPGESVVLTGVPYDSTVELDPTGSVGESDEANNSRTLGSGELLTCGNAP